MSEAEPTAERLARVLKGIPGVPPEMIERARTGYYDDYRSPLVAPELQLFADLRDLASKPQTPRNSRPLIRAVAEAVTRGEYDATREESEAWGRSAEGQAAMAELAGAAPPAASDEDSVRACADLVGRTGATSFEFGHLRDEDPPGWWATATFKGSKVTVDDKGSPVEACDALVARLLTGAQCQHCKKLVSLNPLGAYARDATLVDGRKWSAAEQAKAGVCVWRRTGARWERGCAQQP